MWLCAIVFTSRSDMSLGNPDCARVILEGWSNVRKNVICEAWRKSHFRLIHRAIYGFNIPSVSSYSSRITACPKCHTPLTDLWHGGWLCPDTQKFWDQIITCIDLHWRVTIPKSPELLIFHSTRPPLEKLEKWEIDHSLP